MAREQQRETNGKSVRRSSEKVTSGVSLPSRRRIIIRLPFAIGSKTQRQRFSFLQPFQLFPERSSQTEQQQLFSGASKVHDCQPGCAYNSSSVILASFPQFLNLLKLSDIGEILRPRR